MEKIVYILGAGFSAYAGLPLMSDFLIKSKDMYFKDTERYKNFKKIFENIDRMAKIKNYYKANLFNIEEVLSILEMQQKIGETRTLKKDFIKYIIDVIEYFTPSIMTIMNVDDRWYRNIWGENETLNNYGYLILSILKSRMYVDKLYNEDKIFLKKASNDIEYSIITLNYDMLIEKMIDSLNAKTVHDQEISIPIYKLHGCVSKNNIIPPTWAKDITKELLGVWQKAFKEISSATKIRILGYSLPISDSYIRYFLKSAIIKNERLKEIDIICYDRNGNIKDNYSDFIVFDRMRYQNKKVEDYFNELKTNLPYHEGGPRNSNYYTFSTYEQTHEYFMNK
jgi:hypothetical protein